MDWGPPIVLSTLRVNWPLLQTLLLPIRMDPSITGSFAIILFLLFARLTAAVLTLTGQTLFLDGIPYYVPAAPITTVASLDALQLAGTAGGLVPITVVGIAATNSSADAVGSIIAGFHADDVWNEGFLKGKSTPPTPWHHTSWVALPPFLILECFILL